MCGIAGLVYLNGQKVPRQVIEVMTDTLTHRGPDDGGYNVWGPVALGNRRLAILDLSAAGRQPMTNEDGTLWLVYNGEIYNFQDLRRELERLGHRFRSRTDTEVLLHAYEEWGPGSVRRLNGMFAFALWDERRKQLFLARDPLGIKPLFYSWDGKVLRFGSEVKALLADPTASYSLDPTSLHLFLTFYYLPPPRTLFRTVRQLLPGHFILLDLARRDLHMAPYWDWQPQEHPWEAEEGYARRLETLLDQAVRRALVSDVPFGLFLSGGLDSSTVLHFMTQALQEPVRTFSIGFEDPSYSELAAARQVAQHYHTIHHERVVTAAEVAEVLPQLVWHADEPLADASLVPTYFVSQLAREQVKMVLSGDGGDELFAGYETYTAYFLARAYQRLPRIIRQMIGQMVEHLPVSYRKYSLEMKAKRFVYASALPPDEIHAAWRVAWREEQKMRIYTPEFASQMKQVNPFAIFAEYVQRPRTSNPLNRLLYADLRLYLPGDMLAKVDRASMAHALEVRVPLLDVELVEFMAQVPAHLKLRWWTQKKYLLRKVMRRYLPAEILERPKQGFVVPVSTWLRGPLREFAASVLFANTLYRTGWLRREGVEAIWQEHLQGKQDHGYALWTLMVLGLWLYLFLER